MLQLLGFKGWHFMMQRRSQELSALPSLAILDSAEPLSSQSKTQFSGIYLPNWAVKNTPTHSMPSPFSWPVLVPSVPQVRRHRLPLYLGQLKVDWV